ncbi:MAG: DUF2892 domain-containing protein [Thiohalocapsa sp. PB-PSB1]|jgi:hypothetical protein|nr:MAG: hypothetical protein N838_03600 [Thiohalocapsa sp. PB-PSB1]QQO54062.1 MAG: DUF2892 domain-containing protein [Thiohalocapsa sp. PB-PSB1]
MSMPKNVGSQDSTVRLIVATILIILSFVVASTSAKILFSVIALVLLFTSYTRTCPVYVALKIDTTSPAP